MRSCAAKECTITSDSSANPALLTLLLDLKRAAERLPVEQDHPLPVWGPPHVPRLELLYITQRRIRPVSLRSQARVQRKSRLTRRHPNALPDLLLSLALLSCCARAGLGDPLVAPEVHALAPARDREAARAPGVGVPPRRGEGLRVQEDGAELRDPKFLWGRGRCARPRRGRRGRGGVREVVEQDGGGRGAGAHEEERAGGVERELGRA